MITADIIVDLQYGDCGKGKVAHHLCKSEKYTHVLRYNGGGNAGHTIFHKGKKFVTHQVPAGAFFGMKSVIGPGCVVDPEGLAKELTMLKKAGFDMRGKLLIAKNAHVVTSAHKEEDGREKGIGTTKQGIGPAYRDKHARVGVRAEHIPALRPYLVDLYEEFLVGPKKRVVLAEGAQGFGLDIDWGDYPYVTSSHCTVGGAVINGLPISSVRQIWGVAKIYETYVGKKSFEPKDRIFAKIRELGEEYGATTSRPRQCNWLDIDLLQRAARINGVTHVVLNKVDILRTLGVWKARSKGKVITFRNEAAMKKRVLSALADAGVPRKNVFFSESKEKI